MRNQLAEIYGSRCQLCCKKLEKKQRTLHHRKLKSLGNPTTLENSQLLCGKCHKRIHRFKYDSKEYWELDKEIEQNKIKFLKARE